MSKLNERQAKFVDAYLAGKTIGEAYQTAGYAAKGESATANGWRLMRVEAVAQAIEAGRQQLRQTASMTRDEAVAWLVDVIRTPVGDLDESHPLVQEVTRDEVGEMTVRTKIKMVGKMDAMKELIVMMGWREPEKVTLGADDSLTKLMKRIRSKNRS